MSFLWKVFPGCGHSFHIECILTNLSVCKICESALISKVEILGNAANKAVLDLGDISNSAEDNDDSTTDGDFNAAEVDDGEIDDPDDQPNNSNETISSLLEQIRLWKRANTPQE